MIDKIKNKRLKAFLEKTEGAVTVDFVVLSGVVVLIATFAASSMATKVVELIAGITIL